MIGLAPVQMKLPVDRFAKAIAAKWILIAGGLLSLAVAGPLAAQLDAGAFTVVVTDPGAGLVPNAAITITNRGTNATIEGTTNTAGLWTAQALAPGDYLVTVERSGFTKVVVEHVLLELQKSIQLPVSLTVGSDTGQISVQAVVPILQTEDATKLQLIGGPLKDELPVQDRNFNRLAALTAGVALSTPSGPRDSASAGFTANGISQYQNTYLLDGTDNNSYDQNVNEGRTFAIEPSLDAIAEFSVLTNSSSAESAETGARSLA